MSSAPNQPSPILFFETVNAHQRTAAIKAAIELDVFTAIGEGGATAADVEFYTDSTAHCANLSTNGTQIASATYKLAVDFVFQFKDEASAVAGYNSDSIFGFSVATLKSSQLPVTEGAATGLGKNSIVLAFDIPPQAVYLSVWQNKQFMSILGIFNIDAATDKKIALAENGRIH